jgi:tetratricopeptide (TPR) repeat protein
LGEAAVLGNLGILHAALEERRLAIKYYEEALPLTRALGDKSGEGHILYNMAVSHGQLGEHETAFHLAELAVPLLQAVGSPLAEKIRFLLEQSRQTTPENNQATDLNEP